MVERLRDDDVLVGDVKEPPREGSLLPDTYLFERGDTRQAELTRMAKAQAKLVDEIWAKRASDLPIKSPGELVTLASIVEKETGKADERPRVAGVFVNRLQKHMRLQSDPTIVYGLVFGKGTLGHPITKAELDQPTPYNTYNIDGLPPGPICNPGKAALEAAANPMRTKELYFVADGTGGHAFAETLDQHLKNVAHWRQIEQDAKDRLAPDATPTPADVRRQPSTARSTTSIRRSSAPSRSATRRSTAGRLAARLGKLAENRKAAGALLGPTGALSTTRAAGAKSRHARRGRHGRQRRAADSGVPRRSGCRRRRRSRSPRFRFRRRRSPIRRRASPVTSAPVRLIRASSAVDARRRPARRRERARLRRLRRHAVRSAAQQDLRSQLRPRRAGARDVLRRVVRRQPTSSPSGPPGRSGIDPAPSERCGSPAISGCAFKAAHDAEGIQTS